MIRNGLTELLFTSDGIKQLKAHHYPHVRGGMAFVFICLWHDFSDVNDVLKTLLVLRMLFSTALDVVIKQESLCLQALICFGPDSD